MDSRPITLFLHLINTGGLAIYPALRFQYSWRGVVPPESVFANPEHVLGSDRTVQIVPGFPDDLAAPFEEQLGRIRTDKVDLIVGHFRFGLHAYFDRPCRYFTILRDPVERVVSYYHFLREQSPAVMTRGKAARPMSLQEWIADPRFHNLVHNEQTQSIAGLGGVAWDPLEDLGDVTDRGLLERARSNLDRGISVAGIMERYDETLMLLTRRFGWGRLFYWSRRRKHRKLVRPAVPAEIRAALVGRNTLDVELYEYAKRRFDEQVRAEGPEFGRDVREFAEWNRRVAKWMGALGR